MKSKNKVIAVVILVIISFGIFFIKKNIDHQKELRAQKVYENKVTTEKKRINELQNSISTDNESVINTVVKIKNLNLKTKEAQSLKSKYIEKDVKAVYEYIESNLDSKDIPSNDARFNNIKELQSNVATLENNVKSYQEMENIFNKNKIDFLINKVSKITQKEKDQIVKLQAEETEKARLLAEEEKAKKELLLEQSLSDQSNSSSNSSVNNNINQTTDPVAEADEFRKNFKEQYGREPSSGEVQMDWLRKQGIVK
ncbi:hypothetical protein AMHIJAGA_01500 [Lactococcus lactis]|jgi:hypothetical protein|uniref:Uncharacterized protein n=2 Tax=Bacillati TaxID=1783272 RepID=A0A2X0Q2Q9_9LACT|nr:MULTISPECIES: hypothetical protein [Lactococcus]MCI8686489.1 hypothetical protein [Lactococcus lactis]SPS11566.1 hypothetical protein AMHIJAGA_01500 [Lactococcus lactis]